jgi:sugar O-acyltransferase (sialic acid O-acetyltransferase NeuD family)
MIVIGAGGFAKQLINELKKFNHIVFYDDVTLNDSMFLNKFNIISSFSEATNYITNVDSRFILGIGNPKHRRFFSEKFKSIGGNLTSIISCQSNLSDYVSKIGEGVTILQGSIIEADAFIGDGCLINLNSLVAHDSIIGNYCEISPGALILGNVTVGENSLIGASAVILPNVIIGKNTIVAAGSVVRDNTPDHVMVAGVPAKIIKNV